MIEKEVQYNLKRASAVAGGKKYGATLKHAEDVMDTEATFEELASQLGRPAHQLKNDFKLVLEMLIENTLADGRMRRIDDLFETRLDIEGSFDRLDGVYDPKRHTLRVNFVGLKKTKNLQRKSAPANNFPLPTGRITSVYSLGGEACFLHFGEKIIVEGKDVLLNSTGHVVLRIFVPQFEKEMDFECAVLENTQDKLVCAWPQSEYITRAMFLSAKVAKIIRFNNDDAAPKKRRASCTPHGSQAPVRCVE